VGDYTLHQSAFWELHICWQCQVHNYNFMTCLRTEESEILKKEEGKNNNNKTLNCLFTLHNPEQKRVACPFFIDAGM
jgi:hypothetical protein